MIDVQHGPTRSVQITFDHLWYSTHSNIVVLPSEQRELVWNVFTAARCARIAVVDSQAVYRILLALRNTVNAGIEQAPSEYDTHAQTPRRVYFHPAQPAPRPPIIGSSTRQYRCTSAGTNELSIAQCTTFVHTDLSRVMPSSCDQPTAWISIDRLRPAFIALGDPLADLTRTQSNLSMSTLCRLVVPPSGRFRRLRARRTALSLSH